MYKEQRLAERKYGTAKARPQENFQEFLKHVRQLNQETGWWIKFPLASTETKSRITAWQLPKSAFDTVNDQEWLHSSKMNIKLVEDETIFGEMMQDILQQTHIALDYEFHIQHSYNGMIALIQVATAHSVYVIDPFPLRRSILEIFCPQVLSNGNLLKIMCGADNDVLFTQSNFGTFLEGVFDVQDLYDVWKQESPQECFKKMKNSFRTDILEKEKEKKRQRQYPLSDEEVEENWRKQDKISYKKLVTAFHEQVNLSKDAQHADFRMRPLQDLGPLIEYAAADVHYLIRLYHMLKSMVTESSLSNASLKSNSTLKRIFTVRKYPIADKVMSKLDFDPNQREEQQKLFRRLYKWRDDYSKIIDESPDVVMPISTVMTLVKNVDNVTSVSAVGNLLAGNNLLNTGKQNLHLFAILKNDVQTLEQMNSIVCHNCSGVSHCGWACPFPNDPERLKRFYSEACNAEFKKHQSYRRAYNWYSKTGVWPPNAKKPDFLKYDSNAHL